MLSGAVFSLQLRIVKFLQLKIMIEFAQGIGGWGSEPYKESPGDLVRAQIVKVLENDTDGSIGEFLATKVGRPEFESPEHL